MKKLKVFCTELSHPHLSLVFQALGACIVRRQPCMTQAFFLISVGTAWLPGLLYSLRVGGNGNVVKGRMFFKPTDRKVSIFKKQRTYYVFLCLLSLLILNLKKREKQMIRTQSEGQKHDEIFMQEEILFPLNKIKNWNSKILNTICSQFSSEEMKIVQQANRNFCLKFIPFGGLKKTFISGRYPLLLFI